jgi:hypothetical protein
MKDDANAILMRDGPDALRAAFDNGIAEARRSNGGDGGRPTDEPARQGKATGEPHPPKFILEPFDAIKYEADEEWLVKRVIPRQGVGAIYGESRAFKSFIALDLAFYVACGWPWADRRVTPAQVIYIAAEGSKGVRKRKVGFEKANADRLRVWVEKANADRLPGLIPFSLISTAPNLGSGRDDLKGLIASIKAFGVAPGMIVIDTLAQSLGGAEENGAGMVMFGSNATALANHFGCFVLIVHHVGLTDKERLRGHSSLLGALDAQILAERRKDELATTLTLQKLKDDEDGVKFTALLSRIVIGQDKDGVETSTLIAEVNDGAEPQAAKAKSVPPAQRLLMDVVAVAIDEAGENFSTGTAFVRVVCDDIIRSRYYARIAEKANPGEGKSQLAERQRRTFNRTIKRTIDAKTLIAREWKGERYISLP